MAKTHLFVSSTFVIFIGGGLLTWFTEPSQRRPGRAVTALVHHFFPAAHWRGSSVRVDVMFYLLTKLTQGYIILGASLISVAAAAALRRAVDGSLHCTASASYGAPALVVTAIAMFICGDLGEFLSHRLQHEVKPLWEFHKIHHAATFLTPLTSVRSHPVSNLIDCVIMSLLTAIPAGLAAAFFNFSLDDRLMLAGAVNLALSVGLFSILQHTHFPISFGPLERLFVSPLMHQVHHSRKLEHHNKNYGTRLAIWDWWFGTAVILPKGEPVAFGLNVIEDPAGAYGSLVWCYAGPFIACARMLAGKFRKARAEPNLISS